MRGLIHRWLLLVLLAWPLTLAAQTETDTAAPAQAATEPAAQVEQTFDRAAFDKLAKRADDVLDKGEASSDALEQLRVQLADFRTQAQAVRAAVAPRVAPVSERLTALGPPPEEGETEPAEVADLRTQLQARLAEVQAPVVAAEDAVKQADALIKRIDTLIRDRTKKALLTLGPSPLTPSLWIEAGKALSGYSRSVLSEVAGSWSNAATRTNRLANLPIVALLSGLALLLLFRARRWSRAMQEWASIGASNRSAAAFGLIGALSQILLPTVGLLVLAQALILVDLFQLRGFFLVRAVVSAGFAVYFASWVARLLFTPTSRRPALVAVGPADHRKLRTAFLLLGLVFALRQVLLAMFETGSFGEIQPGVLATLRFPLVVVGGIALVQIGLTLRRTAARAEAGERPNPFFARVSKLMGGFCAVAGLVGPVLAAIGYTQAGGALVFSTALSLLTIAGFYVLFGLIGMLALGPVPGGTSADATDIERARQGALFRVALGFLFIIAAVPVLALIWGMRPSEIQDIWLWLRDGISIGDTRISLTDFLTFVLVFSIGYTITRLLQTALRTTVMPYTRLDTGGQNAIVTGTGYVGFFLAALAAISATGLNLSSLAIVAGALSVGIGFGLQTIVSNFVSGIILLVERPIKLGDWIEVGSYSGYVRKISVRSTEIETFDRANIIIPNADLIAGSVTNWTHSSMAGRVRVPVGVSYGSDPRHVERVLREIAENHPMVLLDPAPVVMFMGFGADSLDFEVRAILRDVNWLLSASSDMRFEIARRFREEGIEIPFAQRDVYIKNLADLRRDGAGRDTADSGVSHEASTSPAHSATAKSREDDAADDGAGDAGDGTQ